MAQAMGRRERLRQATREEIRATARALLVGRGPSAVTINAIAREMGMSGPALYRYYASHDELVAAVTTDFLLELAGVVEQARDACPGDPPHRRLLAMSRAMRGWATSHRAEFEWIFARPGPAASGVTDEVLASPPYRAAQRVEHQLLDQVVAIWEANPFPVPDLEALAPALRPQLEAFSAAIGGRLPPAAAHVYLTVCLRLYGVLCMDVLGQMAWAYSDLEPVFEECLRDVCGMLGVPYEPPTT